MQLKQLEMERLTKSIRTENRKLENVTAKLTSAQQSLSRLQHDSDLIEEAQVRSCLFFAAINSLSAFIGNQVSGAPCHRRRDRQKAGRGGRS
jgi:LytS/YehU family sensor histidine kinase